MQRSPGVNQIESAERRKLLRRQHAEARWKVTVALGARRALLRPADVDAERVDVKADNPGGAQLCGRKRKQAAATLHVGDSSRHEVVASAGAFAAIP
jgi:hypothetical protein